MNPRFIVRTGALALAVVMPVAALAQGVVIDHKEIGCIVVGKYPKMNACFSPAALAQKPRVYFRPETLSTWYYVEMTSDAPCHSGVLLRPTKALIDKHIYYYLDVQGGGSRTAEYAPIVVRSEEECRSKLPIAPLSTTGPAAVYPSFPAGFAGGAGISTGVVAGGVAAAALITGGAILATDDDSPAASTPATVPVTSPPATTPPVTVPPTLPSRPPPPLVITCTATPRNGEAPLRVDFATFASGGTGTYEFLWSFGDGASETNPNPSHTFLTGGVFDSTVRVLSGDLIATCSRPITVTVPPTPGPSPSASPSPTSFKLHVNIVGSGTGAVASNPAGINCPPDCTQDFAPGAVITLTATPATAPPSVFKQWTGHCTGTTNTCVLTMTGNKTADAHFELVRTLTVTGGANNSDVPGSVTSNPPGITCIWNPQVPCTDTATFPNGTTVVLTAALGPGGTRVQWGGDCLGATGLVCNVLMNADKLALVDTFRLFHGDEKKATPALVWSSELEVPDGEGQVVMNGQIAAAARPGLSALSAEGRAGVNRVEAVLARGSGRSGTWRFDFSGASTFRPGSLRVVAGTVVVVTGDTVVFRLEGKAGERVVFTFELEE